jgi:hypothetical protein
MIMVGMPYQHLISLRNYFCSKGLIHLQPEKRRFNQPRPAKIGIQHQRSIWGFQDEPCGS